MNRRHFFIFCLFFITILGYLVRTKNIGDLAIWASQGLQIFKQGTLYISDNFSFVETSTKPYPWLISIIYATIFKYTSLWFLEQLHILVIIYWVFSWCQNLSLFNSETNPKWTSLTGYSLFITVVGLQPILTPRPALIATIPLMLTIAQINKLEILDFKKILKLTFILIFWVNLHGSWPLFFLLFWADDLKNFFLKKSINITKYIFFFLATLINPWGIGAYTYVYETVTLSRKRGITEWDSLNSFTENNLILLTIVFCTFIIYFLIYKKQKIQRYFEKEILFMFLCLHSIRNIPLYFVLFGQQITPFEKTQISNHLTVAGNKYLNLGISLIVIISFSPFLFYQNLEFKNDSYKGLNWGGYFDYHPKILNILNLNEKKNIFNSWAYGAELSLFTSDKYFLDPRNIIFNDLSFQNYSDVFLSPQKFEIFANTHFIQYAFIEDQNTPLNIYLKKSTQWQIILKENKALLYKKL